MAEMLRQRQAANDRALAALGRIPGDAAAARWARFIAIDRAVTERRLLNIIEGVTDGIN
ncbi:MAG: hypothetical protein R2867_05290 [Caldilineaceae bacterium]